MDLIELISKQISNPVGFGRVKQFTHCGAARGPDHEDFIAFQAKVSHGRIIEIRWQGTGCSITLAAASLLAEALEGRQLVMVGPVLTKILSTLSSYKGVCLEVARAAVECCFDWDAKERGRCRMVKNYDGQL